MGRKLIFLILAGATVLSFAGTDLVLPAVPLLPRALGGSVAQAQYVLASFTGGMAAGLLLLSIILAGVLLLALGITAAWTRRAR